MTRLQKSQQQQQCRIGKNRAFLDLVLCSTNKRTKDKANARRLRSSAIGKANRAQICALCEVVKNLLHNPSLGVKVSGAQRRILRKHANHLRELVDRSVSHARKRRILQRGAGAFLLPLIASLAAPIIGRLFGGSSSSSSSS